MQVFTCMSRSENEAGKAEVSRIVSGLGPILQMGFHCTYDDHCQPRDHLNDDINA
uniref:hypothetical protein n=1 Tax=Pararhizobium sp. IMCC3301 TaxID=3067904 RepID=UPI0027417504|nr:hypothetical protein [Pararhizobium sp. IMCC3301]